MLDAYSGEHGVYGIVLVTALIAVGWEDETDFDVLLFVIGTIFVFWLAHIYAAVVASRAAQRRWSCAPRWLAASVTRTACSSRC